MESIALHGRESTTYRVNERASKQMIGAVWKRAESRYHEREQKHPEWDMQQSYRLDGWKVENGLSKTGKKRG